MPSPRYQNRRRNRRDDVIKVVIEEVNLNGSAGAIAQGRDPKDHGLFDIDLTQSVGGSFPTPAVGEEWWIKRGGRAWVLDRIISSTRTSPEGGGGGGGSDDERAGVPGNVDLSFNVREKKTAVEYTAFVTFDAVTTDENGDPQDTSHYIVNWVPCTKAGNIITDEKVRQHVWNPNDDEIDEVDDPAADYYVVLPGNVPRPKVWYWKARVRAVSEGGHKGEWSDWTEPSLPIKDSLPEPPAPDDVALTFRWKDTNAQPVFSAVVKFDDVNYWDIPGFDYEDDVTEYEVQLQPLQRLSSHQADDIEPGDGHHYVRADPNGDGEPWEVRRAKVKDKDDDDTYVDLGTLAEDIDEVDTNFDVDETGAVGTPAAPFIVLTGTGEQWLVTSRTLVSGSTYTYEVYRQFKFTDESVHSNGAALEWLKDPYRYKVDFHHIERPRTVYWRTKVRSKDRFSRIGPWSDWTDPVTPWQSIDFQVPVPLNLKADIEIRDYKTHPEFKLVARFKDPAPNGWNIPGGDLQDDLHHYQVVAEALLPDPDGYIAADPAPWDDSVTYGYNEVVERNGVRYRSLVGGNLNNQPPSGAFWNVTTDQSLFRIPDRKIGVLKAPGGLSPANTTMTVTLDDDLPDSILRILNNPDKQATYLRILTPAGLEDGGTSEVVATLEQTASVGDDKTYTIERMQKGSFDLGHNDLDEVFLLTEHLRRETVADKDEGDPGHRNHWYTVNMGRVAQAKRIWWHVRARSVDTFGHKSAWTPWTQPLHPSTDPDLIIDAPGYVALGFDRVHRNRHNRFRAVVEWEEVRYTAPDGDHEPDVTSYAVQLATSDGDYLELEALAGATTIYVNERRKEPGPTPFFILVSDEYLKVTGRSQSAGQVGTNLWTYVVERATRGSTAAYHPEGARVYKYPHLHQTVSAKHDDDPNGYVRVPFPRAERWNHYKARVKAKDRYNRVSEWTDWTASGTPSDTTPPDEPTNVLIDVDEHKVHIGWDYPTDPRDEDTDQVGQVPSDDVAYFQVQLATAANFNPGSIIRYDRNHLALSKTWRLRKPSRTGTYYARVRAVDSSGNKSDWVGDSGAQSGVPTPDDPAITFNTRETVQKLVAEVSTDGVSIIDQDDHDALITGYEFRLQPAENVRLTQRVTLNATQIHVNSDDNDVDPGDSIWIDNEKMTLTSKTGASDLTWHVTRAVSGTTQRSHRDRSRVYYFLSDSKTINQRTSEETNPGDAVLAIFKQIQNRRYYRAKVKAKDTQGRWGNFSGWSPVVRAVDLTPPRAPERVTVNMAQHHVVVEWDTGPDPADGDPDSSPTPTVPSFIQAQVDSWWEGNLLHIDPFDDGPTSGDPLYAVTLDYDNASTNVPPNVWGVDEPPAWDKVVDAITGTHQIALFQRNSDGTETGDFTFTRNAINGSSRFVGMALELRDVPDPGYTTSFPNPGLTSPDVDVTVENQVVFHTWIVDGDVNTGTTATEDSAAVLPGDGGVALTSLLASGVDAGAGVFGWLFVLPVYYTTTGLKNGVTLTP